MPKYDFDTVINRYNTNSIKYSPELLGKPKDAIPMWVADMDFKVLPQVTEALEEITKQAVFGYSDTPKNYDLTLCRWYKNRFNWNVLPGWVIKTPGVIFAFAAAIKALTKQGDAVIICQPVYHPFANTILGNNRRLIVNPLKFDGTKYEMDFDYFEQQIIKENVKAFLLCSPHNPVAKVWTKEELTKMADICLKHKVYIISDEIHSDLVFAPHKHIPIAALSAEISNITVTCTAPTKTFNIAGLQVSHAFAQNADIKKAVEKECLNIGYNHLNTMGMAAAMAVYTHGEQWLKELLVYLKGNADYLDKELKEIDCGISLVKPEGTYLMWLDCRAAGLSDDALNDFFINKAKIWLNQGIMFGQGGSGFMRMNIACPRHTMEQAMANLRHAAKELKK